MQGWTRYAPKNYTGIIAGVVVSVFLIDKAQYVVRWAGRGVLWWRGEVHAGFWCGKLEGRKFLGTPWQSGGII
jgi:hypothetical protein